MPSKEMEELYTSLGSKLAKVLDGGGEGNADFGGFHRDKKVSNLCREPNGFELTENLDRNPVARPNEKSTLHMIESTVNDHVRLDKLANI